MRQDSGLRIRHNARNHHRNLAATSEAEGPLQVHVPPESNEKENLSMEKSHDSNTAKKNSKNENPSVEEMKKEQRSSEKHMPHGEKSPVKEEKVSIKEVEKLQHKLDELKEDLLRAHADYDNYKRRVLREKESARAEACESILGELLPIIDNFELGLKAAQDPQHADMLKGFSLILDQIKNLLTARGVTTIGKVGEAFDPHQEDALSMIPSEEIPEGHVIEVIRLGYALDKKLLRPAMVIVSSGKSQEVNK